VSARAHAPSQATPDRPEPAALRGARGPVADRLRVLQGAAGNAAVGQLLRRTAAPPATRTVDTVTLTVTPMRTMTGPEFTVFVAAQLQSISETEAATRGDELGGSDSHFTTGVTRAEVAKPITVEVALPAPTASEKADIAARAGQLAALPAAERQAIDEAADWSFQRKVGTPGQARPTQGAAAELWKRSRDEVLRDRNRLDSLPEEIRAIVMPGGRRPDGEYQEALRLAGRLGEFTWEDWVLFERRVGIPDGDLRATKKAVDTFTSERSDERATLERIRDTERLYGLVVRFNAARGLGMTRERYAKWPDYPALLAELAAAGFRDVPDYESALARYYFLFARRAGEIAQIALANSESVVQSEIARYGQARALDALFADLAPLRGMLAANGNGAGAGSRASTPLDDAEAERRRLAVRYPTLADPELPISALGADTPEALGAALLARDRVVLENIGELRKQLSRDPERVLKLDRVLDLTRGELGAEDGSVGHRIVQQHVADIANREHFRDEALVWISIGLGMVTFGSGTLVVLGSAGELVIGAYQAHDEWERYAAAKAAAHSALDPEHSLGSDDPSAVWFTLALMGAGFSVAGLGKALSPAKHAIEVLEHTGDAAKFRAALDEARNLTPAARAALQRTGDAYADFKKALWALAAEFANRPTSLVDPTAFLKGIKVLARHSAWIGIRKFEEFMAMRRELASVLRINEYTVQQRKQIKAAFAEGVREFDATRPVIRVKFKKGDKVVTFGDEMLVDGKPVSKRQRDEVIENAGFGHADGRHGPYKPAYVLADQALDSAAAGGAGMMSQWASDEAMLGSLEPARAEAMAGRAVPADNGQWIVDVPATPDIGRVFVVNSRIPKTATVLNRAPVAGKAVATIAPTHVRAAFTLEDGVYELSSIYPYFKR
jgi:hypothetical protein